MNGVKKISIFTDLSLDIMISPVNTGVDSIPVDAASYLHPLWPGEDSTYP